LQGFSATGLRIQHRLADGQDEPLLVRSSYHLPAASQGDQEPLPQKSGYDSLHTGGETERQLVGAPLEVATFESTAISVLGLQGSLGRSQVNTLRQEQFAFASVTLAMEVNHSTNPTGGQSLLIRTLREAYAECSNVFGQDLEEKQLLQRVCEILVEIGGLRVVTFTHADVDGQIAIGSRIYAGDKNKIAATRNASSGEINLDEPSRIAIRTGQIYCVDDVLSLPIRQNDRLFGALTVCTVRQGEFEPNVIEFLDAFTKFCARELAGLQTRRQRKETEETLTQTESGIRQLVDAIPQHILINRADGMPLFANKAWADYHGQTLEEMRSLGSALDMVHPDDTQRMILECNRGYSGKVPFQTEFRLRRKDGQYRWFLFRLNPLEDQNGNIVRWYSSATDIEDLKRAEDRPRLVLNTTPALIHTALPDGNLDFFNRTWLRYVGLSLEDVQGWKWTASIHPEDVEGIVGKWRVSLASGEPFLYEARMRRADGEYRWMLHHKIAERDEHGQIIKWYGSSIDIEDRKRAEDFLQDALNEVKKLRDQLYKENIALRDEIDKASMFEEIVGTSAALQVVISRLSKVAPTDSTVLITCDTGTGKELIARAVHKRSQRSSRAFVSVNCAAIPRDLIASELFGHEKGSFTGALQRRLGRFELAEGGTLFLDEVGELPLETQITLLRVLQEREFERVGGSQPIRADVRVIAATNRDLETAISTGAFRRDLYYRLNVFPIEIPTLVERKEDIPMLVEYFIDRYSRKAGKKIRSIDKNTLELLQSYSWPGNIRELQNVIERSVIVCETETFSVDPSWLNVDSSRPRSANQPLARLSTAQEKQRIEAALAESEGRVSGPSGAAGILGIPASTLESKIRSLKINKFRFRSR
jgi:PAS domain S-box-containing protein